MSLQLLMLIPVFLLLLLSVPEVEVAEADPQIARHSCKDSCGNVSIPFPFGIGANCFHNPWFEIECKASHGFKGSPKPFLSKFDIEVMEVNINYGNKYGSPNVIVGVPPLNVCTVDTQHQQLNRIDLRGSPYNFSTQHNVLVMKGCPGSVALKNQSKSTMAGCATVCHNNDANSTNECYGVQFCQAPLSSVSYNHFPFYQIDFNLQTSGEDENCLVATLIKSDSVKQYVGKLSTSDQSYAVPVVLSWSWMSNLLPDNNPLARCSRDETNITYCECKTGYYGNPFVSDGCQMKSSDIQSSN